jgi:DNA-binding transcriptional LysR family regulator
MLNWDDLQLFLAVARHGTLSAAARALGVAQPTVGRRLAAFEARLGAQLFERSGSGLTLSAIGLAVLKHAEPMQEHALFAESLASGHSLGVEGEVRVTASEWLIQSSLGPALAPLLANHPGLCVELIADARHFSLVKREADIALRPSQFTHQDIVQRELATVEFALYASEGYLLRHGTPDFARGCAGHVLVQMNEGHAQVADSQWLAALARHARVAVRTNGREAMVTLACASIGITCLPRILGDAVPSLRRLATPTPSPPRKLWLGVHRAARATPRVRVMLDFLRETLRQLQPALQPSA